MDNEAIAAQIKAAARYQPVRDLNTAYAELAMNRDPERFDGLRNRVLFLLAVAEAELAMINAEVDGLEHSLTVSQHLPDLTDQLMLLDREFETIQKEMELGHELAKAVKELSSYDEAALQKEVSDYEKQIEELQADLENRQKIQAVRKQSYVEMTTFLKNVLART